MQSLDRLGALDALDGQTANFDADLLSRIEDASLNASAPPQQRWMDGWLLRFSPGKAKRARCINAVATGRLPLAQKLALSEAAYREAQLPLAVRITPFSQPAGLDATLHTLGMPRIDDTRVMVRASLAGLEPAALPAGLRLERVSPAAFAELVGELRGSPPSQRQAQAQRLELSPVRYEGYALFDSDGASLACGQFAREADLVGLYDVFTAPEQRGRGLARSLCSQLLALAVEQGAATAYLQVEADNFPARAVYRALGFSDGYAYHYRIQPGAEV